MNILFKLKFFEDNFDYIEFWSDCAGHFRSKYMLNYYKNRNKYNTFNFKFSLVNFYTEKHGKSVLDGYFGVLSRWLTDSERSIQIKDIYMLVALFCDKHKYNYNPNSLFKNAEHIIINYQVHNPFIYWEEIKDIQTYLSYSFNCLENKIYICAYRSFNQSHYTKIDSTTKWKENPAYNNKDYRKKLGNQIIKLNENPIIPPKVINYLQRRTKYAIEFDLIDSNLFSNLIT
jgi:hypothetical protein